jgi:hypothetical protein
MGDLIRFDRGRPKYLVGMGVEELRREWRATQDDMIALSEEQVRIAEALWPDGGEGPSDWREAGVTGDELVAGVKSLHEYADRLLEENEWLRAEVAARRRP